MKHLFLLALAVPFAGNTYAQQIPNASFEDWETVSYPVVGVSTLDPTSYFTLNEITTGYDSTGTVGVTRTTDAHSGNYALRLTSAVFDATAFGGSLDTSAIAQMGSLSIVNNQPVIVEGIPFAYRPTKFSFWYKYQPVGATDTAVVHIDFKKSGNHIGQFNYKLSGGVSVNTYTNVVADITWWDPDTTHLPDTMRISFASSETGMSAGGDPIDGNKIGNTLYIDDVSFVYGNDTVPTAINDMKADLNVSIYPNPASDKLNILYKDVNKGKAMLNIYDVLGAIVNTTDINKENEQIDVQDLPNGYYIVELKNSLGTAKKRVLISR